MNITSQCVLYQTQAIGRGRNWNDEGLAINEPSESQLSGRQIKFLSIGLDLFDERPILFLVFDAKTGNSFTDIVI